MEDFIKRRLVIIAQIHTLYLSDQYTSERILKCVGAVVEVEVEVDVQEDEGCCDLWDWVPSVISL